jgi:hypothetical protein
VEFWVTSARKELQQALEIAFGKPYLLQCIFGHRAFPELVQDWCPPVAFPDLPHSSAEACRFYSGSSDEAHEEARLLWFEF